MRQFRLILDQGGYFVSFLTLANIFDSLQRAMRLILCILASLKIALLVARRILVTAFFTLRMYQSVSVYFPWSDCVFW